MDERSLAEVATVDSTPTVTPQDFSFEDFLNGVRAPRRSIKIYPRGDLIARLDEIVTEIEAAPDDQDVDDLIDEYERVKAEFQNGVWFTVEKRSSEWAEQFRLDAEKRLGMKRVKGEDDATPGLSAKDQATITVHQLAEQIVVPTAMTYERLRRLSEVNEGEFSKLVYAMIDVNTHLPQAAEVLSRDFSQRRSGSR